MSKEIASLIGPFVGAAMSLLVAFIFFWKVPRRQHKQDLAIDFFKMYNTNEMKLDRQKAWTYLHPAGVTPTGTDGVTVATAKHDDATKTRTARIQRIVEWTITTPTGENVEIEIADLQSVLRVFNFFGACEDCLQAKQFDDKLFQSLLAFSFDRWKADIGVIAEEVARAHDKQVSPKTLRPTWSLELKKLSAMCVS